MSSYAQVASPHARRIGASARDFHRAIACAPQSTGTGGVRMVRILRLRERSRADEAPEHRIVVATLITEPAPASEATARVGRQRRRARFAVHVGRVARRCGEAAWREARWAFRATRRGLRGERVTGHTRDDQVETVVMRAARGGCARARGMVAQSAVERPLLHVAGAFVRSTPRVSIHRRSDQHVARLPAQSGSPRPVASASPGESPI